MISLRDWRVKVAIQKVLSALPQGHSLNYSLQRNIFKSLPVDDDHLIRKVEISRFHFEAAQRYGRFPMDGARFMEFGAGADLCVALSLFYLGVPEQLLFDVVRIAKHDLVLDMLKRIPPHLSENLCVPPPLPPRGTLEDVLRYCSIDYRAPGDARNTGLPPSSVQCITSTDTLEHIPPEEIASIYRECYRILSDDGVMSFDIDYQDHYSFFDSHIDAYNFLQYGDKQWKWLNPSLHYQNRLRHDDHVVLLYDAGFDIVYEEHRPQNEGDVATLERMTLAKRFDGLPVERLAIRGSKFVVRKRV